MVGINLGPQGAQTAGRTVFAVVQRTSPAGSLHAPIPPRSTGSVLQLRDALLQNETQSGLRAPHPNPFPAARAHRGVQPAGGTHDHPPASTGTDVAEPN